MLDYGLGYEGRRLANQYGDGAAILAFWKDDIYWYTRSAKVRLISAALTPYNTSKHPTRG